MNVVNTLKVWVISKIERVLGRIGEANSPPPHDYDHIPENGDHLQNSDRVGEEKGEFGGRY